MKSDEKSHFQKIRNCAPLEALWGEGASDSVEKKELAAHSAHSGFETVQDKQHMGNIKLYTGPSNCFVFLYQVTATDREHFAQRLKISLALMCFRNI